MFLAKCLDKLKLFERCIQEYEKTLTLYKTQEDEPVEDSLLGNIHFRLGWAQVRGKIDIEKGIANLK